MTANAEIHSISGIKSISFEAPVLIAELLKAADAHIDMPCGRQGKCGKCRVKVTGSISTVDECEVKSLSIDEINSDIRLACRCFATGDVIVYADEKRQEIILTDFSLPQISLTPKNELGLAVDIGTTTVAAYLYDLSTGECLATCAVPNPQRSIGADVTARLKASIEGRGKELKEMICRTLCTLTEQMLKETKHNQIELTEAVVAGNTAMLYLLTGTPVESIAYPPFEALTLFGEYVSGDKIGLYPHLKVWLPKCISAYVGADITCAMLYASSLPEHEKKPLLLADIGTNGEMALFCDDKIFTCSTAAGPAFEGAGIRFGMTASGGAICHADLIDGVFTYETVGGIAPVGICGTGLIDTASALLKAGAIDETGRLGNIGHSLEKNIVTYEGQPAFKYPHSEIYLTQADIRAVQLAKAAVCAGMLTLCSNSDISISDVKALQIAGGFGSFICAASAESIGLIPLRLAQKATAIGNGAAAGAVMMLLSDVTKEKGAKLVSSAKTVDLTSSTIFSDNFIDCMGFE